MCLSAVWLVWTPECGGCGTGARPPGVEPADGRTGLNTKPLQHVACASFAARFGAASALHLVALGRCDPGLCSFTQPGCLLGARAYRARLAALPSWYRATPPDAPPAGLHGVRRDQSLQAHRRIYSETARGGWRARWLGRRLGGWEPRRRRKGEKHAGAPTAGRATVGQI